MMTQLILKTGAILCWWSWCISQRTAYNSTIEVLQYPCRMITNQAAQPNRKTSDFRMKYKTEVLPPISRNAGTGPRQAVVRSATSYLFWHLVCVRPLRWRNTFQEAPDQQLQDQALHQLHAERVLYVWHEMSLRAPVSCQRLCVK